MNSVNDGNYYFGLKGWSPTDQYGEQKLIVGIITRSDKKINVIFQYYYGDWKNGLNAYRVRDNVVIQPEEVKDLLESHPTTWS